MAIESDGPKTSDIIEYLQEHGLWDDPEGDMDPKELRDFCESLMLTQEVGIADISDWVALKKARDITEETVEETGSSFGQFYDHNEEEFRPISEKNIESTDGLKQTRKDVEMTDGNPFEGIVLNKNKKYRKVLKIINTTPAKLSSDIDDAIKGCGSDNIGFIRISLPVNVGPNTVSSLISLAMNRLGNRLDIRITHKKIASGCDVYIKTLAVIDGMYMDISTHIELD